MTLIKTIRKSICARITVFVAYLILILQPLIPTMVKAGNGPLQPEFQGATVDSNEQLVDPFSGDFHYAVDLMSEAGIPLSLNYTAGMSMDQDASWVGLGWNFNPGSIVRNLRGLPDDFMGDELTEDNNIRPNITGGLSMAIGPNEVFGIDASKAYGAATGDGEGASVGIDFHYNTYTGFGMGTFVDAKAKINDNLSLGLTMESGNESSFGGVGIQPDVSLVLKKSGQEGDTERKVYGINLSAGFSTSTGLQSFNVGAFKDKQITKTSQKDGSHDYNEGQKRAGVSLLNFQNSYTPTIGKEFLNQSYSLHGTLGAEVLFADAGTKITGYYSSSTLKEKYHKSPAYGYLYLKNDDSNDYITDINRENDVPISPSSPSLPIGYYTYDVYSVNAPGVGGNFRAYRNDLGYLQDEQQRNTSISGDLGVQVAALNAFKGGVDVIGVYGQSTSKPFVKTNTLTEGTGHLQYDDFENKPENNVYFKFMGETFIETEPSFTNNFASKVAVEGDMRSTFLVPRIKSTDLIAYDHNYYPEEILGGSSSHTTYSMDANNDYRNGRVANSKSIQYYTREDVNKYYGGETKYQLSAESKDHHIQKIIITSEDGTKYVFGLPVYNHDQQEITFNVGGAVPPVTALDEYLAKYSSTERSVENKSGLDHSYKNVHMPAYVTSYLLTEILSADYVDVQGNGPSDDDLGTYIVYTYGEKNASGKYEPNMPAFKWRTPTTENTMFGSYVKGMTNNSMDDRVNILYGEKEVWYLTSIETKTHVANFFISDRKDGYTTLGIDGGISTTTDQCLKQLDRIEIYSKFDKIRNDFTPAAGLPAGSELVILDNINYTPIKTIYFTYDYTLCPGVPNNTSVAVEDAPYGRLTLKKIAFKYFNSNKSLYNYYSFEYNTEPFPDGDDPGSEPDYTPMYHPLASDKWGTVQKLDGAQPSQVFPYTKQDNRALSDYYAGLWNLKKINLPDGGYIEVDYEADDYAYVQDKKAGEMFTLNSSFSGKSSYTSYLTESNFDFNGNLLHEHAVPGFDNDGESYFYISFNLNHEIPDNISQTQIEADKLFKDKFLIDYNLSKDIGNNLYFRFYMGTDDDDNTTTDDNKEYRYEYIEGYASIDYDDVGVAKKAGATATDPYTLGYVKLKPAYYLTAASDIFASTFKPEDYDDDFFLTKEINPITKASWQYTMLNCQQYITDDAGPDESLSAVDYLADLLGKLTMLETFFTMFMNPNQLLNNRDFGTRFDPALSEIRLHHPNGYKIGGGHRVKEIRYGDDWRDMTDEGTAEKSSQYGVQYKYVNPESMISSGVAAYEPLTGGEENPHRYPNTYNHYSGSYAYAQYLEHPFGESFFPSASVGYAYVEEIPFGQFETAANEWSEKYQDIGKTTYEFYTAKDYPTIVSNTEHNPINKHFKPSIFSSFFQSTYSDLYAGSQGFVIETNDMHGKQKKVAVLSKEGEIISSTEYAFFESSPGFLSNNVSVIDNKGVVSNVEMGVTYDIFNDHRINNTFSLGGGVKLGIDLSSYVPPIPAVTAYPNVVATKSTNALSVITKHVQRSGILKQVTKNTNGSILKSNNLVFDNKTGSPIIVSEQNEFNDTYFVVSMPSHWIYDGMGFANQNWGYRIHSHYNPVITLDDYFNLTTGQIIDDDLTQRLVPGDRIGFTVTKTGGEVIIFNAWVYQQIIALGGGEYSYSYYCIDEYGNPINFGLATSIDKIDGIVLSSGRKNLQSTPTMSVICTKYPVVASGGISKLSLSSESGIIDASVTEFSDIWKIFCTDDIIGETGCACNDNLTSGATALFELLEQLATEGNFYNPSDGELFTATPEPTYSHGFSPELAAFFFVEGHELDDVSWSSDIIEGTNLLNCNISPQYIPQYATKCDFNLDFGATTLSESLLNDIFSEPDELTMEFIVPESDVEACANVNSFTVVFNYINNEGGAATISAECEVFDCFDIRICNEFTVLEDFCMGGEGDNVNPYRIGLRGNWKPKISYKYLTERNPEPYFVGDDPVGDVANIRTQGVYASFSPFWQLNTSNSWEKHDANWQWSVRNNQFDPLAHTAETENALGIFGAATYNLNHVATEMVANNAGYWQIAFENYEDDIFLDTYQPSECHAKHFDIVPDAGGEISRRHAHSGNFSMRLGPEGYAEYVHTLTTVEAAREVYETPPMVISPKDCMPEFAPGITEEGKEYLLTFWYKDPLDKSVFASTALNVEIKLDAENLIEGSLEISEEIEKWRRVSCKFKMPADIDEADLNQFSIKISNTNTTTGFSLYIDDVKVMPSDAQANCYVYDFISQKMMAELDDNHYATFYEYDDEGNLLRIKKETERGIYTIQDARYNIQKKD